MDSFSRLAAIRWFFLLSLLWCVNMGFSQQLTLAPSQDTTLNWLSATAARTQLQNKLAVLNAALPAQTPDTPSHTDLLRQILFYKAIMRAVAKELPLSLAIENALPEAASLGGVKELVFTSQATLRTLHADAVDLLTN